MSASMIGRKGRVQKEREVVHVICDRIIDYGQLLHEVGEMSFTNRTGRGDGVRHAGTPDRGDAGWQAVTARLLLAAARGRHGPRGGSPAPIPRLPLSREATLPRHQRLLRA